LTLLNNIPGQDRARNILINSYNRDRLASTYLFYGEDGLGKWSMAIGLAALVNCENHIKDDAGLVIDACGECTNCRQILKLTFPELLLALPLPPHKSSSEAVDLTLEYLETKRVEPYRIIRSAKQKTIPINSARAIKRKTAIKPAAGVTRLILFYQMDKMLHASADSLLKLIEEPPPRTIIVLTAKDPESLLPTIQSRSQRINFRPLGATLIRDQLIRNYNQTQTKAELIGRLSHGSLGQALSLVEDEASASLRQTSLLVLKQIFQKDNPSAVATLNEFINPNNRGEAEQILSFWQSFMADIIILKYGKDVSEIINIDFAAELEKLAVVGISSENLNKMMKAIKNILLAVKRNVHLRPALTALVLDLKKYINQSA